VEKWKSGKVEKVEKVEKVKVLNFQSWRKVQRADSKTIDLLGKPTGTIPAITIMCLLATSRNGRDCSRWP